MSGPLHRRERGYVLAEALVGGAVMLLAVGGVFGALSQAHENIGQAMADQTAAQVAVEQLEWLRVQPLSSTAWTPDTPYACPVLPVPLPDGWTCVITVNEVSDDKLKAVSDGWPVAGPLLYRRGVVEVSYRGGVLALETVKW